MTKIIIHVTLHARIGNFGIPGNKWKVKTETGKIIIVNDSELTKAYSDDDFLNKFKYRF